MKNENLTTKESEIYEKGYVDGIWWATKILIVLFLGVLIVKFLTT